MTSRPDINEALKDTAVLPGRCAFSDEKIGVWLFQADCLEFMDSLCARFPDGLFDAIFADPPYFLSNGGITCHAGRMVKVDKGRWDKSQGPELNHEFNRAWLLCCQRLLLPHGTIWVSGTHHVIHSVGFAMQQLAFKILNEISWEKPNPPPNLSCRYFTHSTETVIWAAKNKKSRHRFNYHLMRQLNGGRQMKTVWTFTAPGREEKRFGRHPTQKPLALLERILLASTDAGNLVFDPFSGSCSTGLAAIRTGRKFLGTELAGSYVELSVARLKHAAEQRRISPSSTPIAVEGK